MDLHGIPVFSLSPSEKLQLVEDLWDDLAAASEDVPIYEWQKAELDRRKEQLKSAPMITVSWEDIKQQVRTRHGR
jgi:putative addiction module component (TIGR02574 family)